MAVLGSILWQLGLILGPSWPHVGRLGGPVTLQKSWIFLRFLLIFATWSSLFQLGSSSSIFASSWPHLRGYLGPSWCLLGPSGGSAWGMLWPLRGPLEPASGHLGRPWCHIGASAGHLQAILDISTAISVSRYLHISEYLRISVDLDGSVGVCISRYHAVTLSTLSALPVPML